MDRNQVIKWVGVTTVGISFLAYISTKAWVSSFTHDESFTYLHYPHMDFWTILIHDHCYTNNHLLNTLLMKISEICFGTSEFTLRLPNLLLFIVYFAFGAMTFRRAHPIIGISICILLCTNNLLVDLFGLARGYGLSMGFMLMGIYFYLQSLEKNRLRHLAGFHVAATLAVLSNFTLLTFYSGILFTDLIIGLLRTSGKPGSYQALIKANLPHLAFLFPATLIMFKPIRNTFLNNILDFGGKQGFYTNTVSDVVQHAFGGSELPGYVLLGLYVVLTALPLFYLAHGIRNIWKGKCSKIRLCEKLVAMSILTIAIPLMIVSVHHVFDADYPMGRFAVFLFPIFVVFVGFAGQYSFHYISQRLAIFTMSPLVILLTISFIRHANLYSCGEWAYDSQTKNVVSTLVKHRDSLGDTLVAISLGANPHFEPSLNFYRTIWGLEWMLPVKQNGFDLKEDFIYAFQNDLTSEEMGSYQIIRAYPTPWTMLIKRNHQ